MINEKAIGMHSAQAHQCHLAVFFPDFAGAATKHLTAGNQNKSLGTFHQTDCHCCNTAHRNLLGLKPLNSKKVSGMMSESIISHSN